MPSNRPNILILVSDDQTWSTFSRDLMPTVYAQLVDKGVVFTRGYVNESLCCPSRAQILTGLYGHHTGVDQNPTPLDRPTIVEGLHDLGYRTGLSGKYLNSWPCDPRPEFDDWFCSAGGLSNYSLVDPTINVNGTWVKFSGYTTDIQAQHALDFINATPDDQPFFVMYTPTSPHLPANDPRCAGSPVTSYRPPSYDEDTEGDGKPFYMQRGPLTGGQVASIDQDHQVMTQAVECLDGSMGLLLDGLGQREQNTLVFYLSDNGYLYGEHRRWEKRAPYEESVRVPFVLRYPPLLPEDQAFVSDALVENVDIAVTIADLLGIHWGGDGASLAPILSQQSPGVRGQLLTEYCEGESFPCPGGQLEQDGQLSVPSLFGATTPRYVYVEYWGGEHELYDLQADPYEMANLAGNPSYADVQADVAQRLADLVAPPPTDTTVVSGPAGLVTTDNVSFVYFSQSRLATYECRLDLNAQEGAWTSCGNQTTPYTGLADGDYVFNVRGTDEYGVTDPTPDVRSFSVDAVPPEVTIDSGPPPATHDPNESFSFSSTEPGARFECSLQPAGTAPVWQSCSSPANYGPLDDGGWIFEVRAIDRFGIRSDPPAEVAFEVRTTGPIVLFDSAPLPFTNQTSASFAFHPDEPTIGPILCGLDEGGQSDCTEGTFSAVDLAEDPHQLAVTATDEFGNTAETDYPWTVDVTSPGMTVTSGPASPTVDTSAVFTFTATEGGATAACSLDAAPSQPCLSGVTYGSLSTTGHEFSVQATDRAGNTGPPASWSWTVVPLGASPSVMDFAFRPKTVTLRQGGGVQWTFTGPSDHTVTDASRLTLFDSGARGPGSTFLAVFVGAGIYSYQCRIYPDMKGTVRVPLQVSPLSGGVGTVFTVTWSSAPPPLGLVFDVAIKRPGSTTFVAWQRGQTGTSATFIPDAGVGQYSFKARVQNPVTKAATTYSPVKSITVT